MCTPVNSSALLTLRTGELFRAKFRVPSGVTRDIVILSYLRVADSGFNSSTIVHRLYDGTTLLGMQDYRPYDTVAFWKSPESLFGTPGDGAYGLGAPAASVNFDSITNATIDGRVELAVVSGAVTIRNAEQADISLLAPAPRNFFDTRRSEIQPQPA
jgi:hypothetical protein